jgi:hypothetical protein
MADFLLVILTVIAVGLGAFHLGRLSMKDRVEYLLDELDAEVALNSHPFSAGRTQPRHPSLRLVRGEE